MLPTQINETPGAASSMSHSETFGGGGGLGGEALIRSLALINFSGFQRLGTYSNKYGIWKI